MADDKHRTDEEIHHYERGIPILNGRVDDLENQARETQQRDNDYKDAQIKLNRRLVWFTGILAFVGVVGGVIGGIQAQLANETLRQIKDSKADTNKIIKASETQATAAANISSASGDFSDSAYWMEQHMDDAAKAMQDSVDSAERNTKTTIDNAENAFRAEQRAWIGVQGVADVAGFTATEPWKITVVFFNSGRTPARNVQISTRFIISPLPIPGPSPEKIAELEFAPTQSIAPQGFFRHTLGREIAAEGSSASQREGQQALVSKYEPIKAKQLLLYYYGILKYEDIFGNQRETQFCIYLANTETKEAGVCDAFNDLD